MPKKRTYTRSQIDELSRKLQDEPAPERELSTKQAVEAMKNVLLEKQREGWTLAELAQWLSSGTFIISPSALGDYLDQNTKRKGTKEARTNTVSKPKTKVTTRITRPAAAPADGANVTQPNGTPEPNARKVEQKRLPLGEYVVTE